VTKAKRSLSKRNMRPVLHESMLGQADPYLFDLMADRYFGELQPARELFCRPGPRDARTFLSQVSGIETSLHCTGEMTATKRTCSPARQGDEYIGGCSQIAMLARLKPSEA